ncbi:MAG: hypothetical protein QM737_20915 [Ferruginibacter sp.]
MKKIIGVLGAVTLITTVVMISCQMNKTKTVDGGISKDSLIKRGEYLVTIAGCDDCHSPKKMGPMDQRSIWTGVYQVIAWICLFHLLILM